MDELYVIHDITKSERIDSINENFSGKFKINIVEAVKPEIPNPSVPQKERCCLKSHQKAVKHAKDNNMPYIFVLEDDAVWIDDNCFNIFQHHLTEILSCRDEWDVFYFGFFLNETGGHSHFGSSFIIKMLRENIFLVHNVLALHAVIYNSSSYEQILRADKCDLPIDIIPPLTCRQGAILPSIIAQRHFISGIRNNFYDHFKLTVYSSEKMITTNHLQLEQSFHPKFKIQDDNVSVFYITERHEDQYDRDFKKTWLYYAKINKKCLFANNIHILFTVCKIYFDRKIDIYTSRHDINDVIYSRLIGKLDCRIIAIVNTPQESILFNKNVVDRLEV
jgi:hypothetical protein